MIKRHLSKKSETRSKTHADLNTRECSLTTSTRRERSRVKSSTRALSVTGVTCLQLLVSDTSAQCKLIMTFVRHATGRESTGRTLWSRSDTQGRLLRKLSLSMATHCQGKPYKPSTTWTSWRILLSSTSANSCLKDQKAMSKQPQREMKRLKRSTQHSSKRASQAIIKCLLVRLAPNLGLSRIMAKRLGLMMWFSASKVETRWMPASMQWDVR